MNKPNFELFLSESSLGFYFIDGEIQVGKNKAHPVYTTKKQLVNFIIDAIKFLGGKHD